MAFYPRPEEVNAKKCPKGEEPGHICVHDWRVYWGNVERQVTGEFGT